MSKPQLKAGLITTGCQGPRPTLLNFLNSSTDGDSTTSLGNFFQYFTTPVGKIILPMCNQNFPFLQMTCGVFHTIARCFQECCPFISCSHLVKHSLFLRLSKPSSHSLFISWGPFTALTDWCGYVSIFLEAQNWTPFCRMQSPKCWVRGNNHFFMKKLMTFRFSRSFFFFHQKYMNFKFAHWCEKTSQFCTPVPFYTGG